MIFRKGPKRPSALLLFVLAFRGCSSVPAHVHGLHCRRASSSGAGSAAAIVVLPPAPALNTVRASKELVATALPAGITLLPFDRGFQSILRGLR